MTAQRTQLVCTTVSAASPRVDQETGFVHSRFCVSMCQLPAQCAFERFGTDSNRAGTTAGDVAAGVVVALDGEIIETDRVCVWSAGNNAHTLITGAHTMMSSRRE